LYRWRNLRISREISLPEEDESDVPKSKANVNQIFFIFNCYDNSKIPEGKKKGIHSKTEAVHLSFKSIFLSFHSFIPFFADNISFRSTDKK
jgi:hypothetical protein